MKLIKWTKIREYEGKFTTAIESDHLRTWRILLTTINGKESYKVVYIDLPTGYKYETLKRMLLDNIVNTDSLDAVVSIHLGDIK